MELFNNKVIFVTPTYQCNAVCAKCMTRMSVKRGTVMSENARNKLVMHLKNHNYSGCISMGTAEPLLDDGLPELVESILKINDKVWFRILTNGLALDRLEDMPSDSRVRYGITMDGMEPGPYLEYLQKGMDIDRVKELIRKYSDRLCDSDSYLNYTVYQDNYKQLPAFCEFAAECGIKNVFVTEVKVFESFESELEGHTIAPSDELNRIIDESKSILRERGIDASNLVMFKHNNQYGCYLSDKAGPIIDADGTVSFCRGREDMYVGNIVDEDIDKKWRAFADSLDTKEWCGGCLYRKKLDGTYPLPSTIRRKQNGL